MIRLLLCEHQQQQQHKKLREDMHRSVCSQRTIADARRNKLLSSFSIHSLTTHTLPDMMLSVHKYRREGRCSNGPCLFCQPACLPSCLPACSPVISIHIYAVAFHAYPLLHDRYIYICVLFCFVFTTPCCLSGRYFQNV